MEQVKQETKKKRIFKMRCLYAPKNNAIIFELRAAITDVFKDFKLNDMPPLGSKHSMWITRL